MDLDIPHKELAVSGLFQTQFASNAVQVAGGDVPSSGWPENAGRIWPHLGCWRVLAAICALTAEWTARTSRVPGCSRRTPASHSRDPPHAGSASVGGAGHGGGDTGGLRCQDVHSGLRNVDPHSPALGPLADTRVIGMAATVAGLIRGRDVVADAQSLSVIAAAQLDVDTLAFNEVVAVLEDVDYVQGVQRNGSKITSFTENVPYYDDLYQALGESWDARRPTDLERQLLVVVDGLSTAPVPLEELEDAYGLDGTDLPRLLDVGQGAGLVRPSGRTRAS